ncbi:hypothetical protein FM037_11340 [Shewanella psychropiezotolerans]|uniref:Uncharacterized protein n=1 Tax=Shewanella psychropiezotolerans TaxID=2593655 RepID=A0ABX5WY59_9GAMM|nr:hypothetical protein [Shewanella psychropiezotolerans]QDO83718.1 hypothetical protein FM037_11340 [Shewanella psychropiezotolerans]
MSRWNKERRRLPMVQLGKVMILAEGRTHGGGEVALWMRSMSRWNKEQRRLPMVQLGKVMILTEGRTHGGGEVALWMRSIQLLCSERRRRCRTERPTLRRLPVQISE